MKCQEDKEEYDYIISKGFKIDFLDDMSGWWYYKKIKPNEFIGDIKIAIEDFHDDGMITVSTYDKSDDSVGMVDIINQPYTRKNLKKIIKFLTQ